MYIIQFWIKLVENTILFYLLRGNVLTKLSSKKSCLRMSQKKYVTIIWYNQPTTDNLGTNQLRTMKVSGFYWQWVAHFCVSIDLIQWEIWYSLQIMNSLMVFLKQTKQLRTPCAAHNWTFSVTHHGNCCCIWTLIM